MHDAARPRGLVERVDPAFRKSATWRVLSGKGDAACRHIARHGPDEHELARLLAVRVRLLHSFLFRRGILFRGIFLHFRFFLFGAAALGREGPFAFGVGSATRGEVALGEAVRVRAAASANGCHALELAPLHFEHRTAPEPCEQVRVPRLDRHGNAVAHEVHIARIRRRHERAVPVRERRRGAHRVAVEEVAEVRALGEVIVRGGVDPPRLEHPLPPERAHLLPKPIARAFGSLQEPKPASILIVVHRRHLGVTRDARPLPHACEFGVRDKRHVREIVVSRGEAALGDERPRLPLLHEIHRALARRLHERAVRMPERHRQHGGVVVPGREVTHEVAHRDALDTRAKRAITRRELESLFRGAVDPVVRRIAVVASDVEMIPRRIARRPFESDDLPRGHLALVLHENGGQVRHDDVGSITLIDVHVVAEVGVRIGIVHVGNAARGRVNDLVHVVRGIEVDVVPS